MQDRIILFTDEARFCAHSKHAHEWFLIGLRSSVKVKHGFKNCYVYGEVEPSSGEMFSLMLPEVNTELMNLFLQEMSGCYKDEKIVLVIDGAGLHKSKNSLCQKTLLYCFYRHTHERSIQLNVYGYI